MINKNNEKIWSIFQISKGYGKGFVSRVLNKYVLIKEVKFKTKYSDDSILKFTKEEAIKIIKHNIRVGDKYGIVNNKGIQELFDWRIKYETHDQVN